MSPSSLSSAIPFYRNLFIGWSSEAHWVHGPRAEDKARFLILSGIRIPSLSGPLRHGSTLAPGRQAPGRGKKDTHTPFPPSRQGDRPRLALAPFPEALLPELTSYGEAMTDSEYSTTTLKHLGIIAGVIRQIGLIETHDRLIPPLPTKRSRRERQ